MINEELEKTLDTYFPKGDKRRGDALVIFATGQKIIDKIIYNQVELIQSTSKKITSLQEELNKPKVFIRHVTACHDSEFHGIECLETEDRVGFFPDNNDVRPGHCIWLDKKEAERLWELFA